MVKPIGIVKVTFSWVDKCDYKSPLHLGMANRYCDKWVVKRFQMRPHRVWNRFITLRPKQNGRHFPDIFKWIFVNENAGIWTKISLKFVPRSPINNIPALVQILAGHRPGDKPLSEPMMVSLLTYICVTRPQWVNPRESKVYTYHNQGVQVRRGIFVKILIPLLIS